MLTLTRAVRVFACAAPVDMRKGFDGLGALVEQRARLLDQRAETLERIAEAVHDRTDDRPPEERPLLCVDGVHGFGVEDVGMDETGFDFFAAVCGQAVHHDHIFARELGEVSVDLVRRKDRHA